MRRRMRTGCGGSRLEPERFPCKSYRDEWPGLHASEYDYDAT